MPRSFLIKKSAKVANNSSNINTSYLPNGCTPAPHDCKPASVCFEERGPFDLSIKSRLLKEANISIKCETPLAEKANDANISPHFYSNAQYRDSPLFALQSATSAKCISPHNLSPINADLGKHALIPLEPLHSGQRLSPQSLSRHFPIAPYVSFGFSGCASFGYNENKNIATSPSLYYQQQSRHPEYPISPPQTPILNSERSSATNYASLENRHRVISPVSEYRPQYMSTWNDSIKGSSGALVITSPTPSLNGSDDSGRGSVHSRGSAMSLKASKYQESLKGEEKVAKSRKAANGSDGNATRYHCSDCNKSYSTYSGLSKHREFHCATQAKKAFSCKHCDKVYVSLGALKMHIRTHTLPCKCKLCGKAFSRPWLLQGHIRTHTGEKPFACQYCSRAFADRSNLRAHLQTHSDVKKYSCKTCSKTFSRMSLLLKHEDGGCANHRLQ